MTFTEPISSAENALEVGPARIMTDNSHYPAHLRRPNPLFSLATTPWGYSASNFLWEAWRDGPRGPSVTKARQITDSSDLRSLLFEESIGTLVFQDRSAILLHAKGDLFHLLPVVFTINPDDEPQMQDILRDHHREILAYASDWLIQFDQMAIQAPDMRQEPEGLPLIVDPVAWPVCFPGRLFSDADQERLFRCLDLLALAMLMNFPHLPALRLSLTPEMRRQGGDTELPRIEAGSVDALGHNATTPDVGTFLTIRDLCNDTGLLGAIFPDLDLARFRWTPKNQNLFGPPFEIMQAGRFLKRSDLESMSAHQRLSILEILTHIETAVSRPRSLLEA